MKYNINISYKLQNPNQQYNLEDITTNYYSFITTNDLILEKDSQLYDITTYKSNGELKTHDINIEIDKDNLKLAYIRYRNLSCEFESEYVELFIELLPRFYLIRNISRDNKIIFDEDISKERINENIYDAKIIEKLNERLALSQ